jgi:hypothetical protein
MSATPTLMIWVTEDDPWLLLAVRRTSKLPPSVKVWVGFCSLEVAPSLNTHSHRVGLLEDESVN